MSSYFVAQIDIRDPKEYERYLEGFDEIFERYEGQVVAVDDEIELLEGRWPSGRMVLIRFPGREELLAWYRSEDYQRLAVHRHNASNANIVLVEGRPE